MAARFPVAHRALALVVAVVAVVAVLAGVTAVRTTSAAWVDSAYATTNVSTGTWTTGVPSGTCAVLNKNGNPTGKACAVTGLRGADFNDGSAVGDRTANLYVNVSAPQAKSDGSEQIELTLDLRAATGLPVSWVWATSGIGAGNLTAFCGFACSSLPTLKAYAPGWAGGGGDVYFALYEKRAGRTGLACA
jgi:hypothetical protein